MRRRFLSFVVMVAIFIGTLGGAVFAANSDVELNLQGIELYATHQIFTDVKDTDWFYDYVDYAYYWGLFKGTSDDTFGPNETMTRAMFATVIFRCYNIDGYFTGIGEEIFSDVKPTDYYYDAVTFCYYAEVIKGVGGGRFDPDKPVNRQEAATMMGRLFDTEGETILHKEYADSSSIDSWALENVDIMAASKLMEGYPDNTFRPLNDMSRAECAKVLSLFHYILNSNK